MQNEPPPSRWVFPNVRTAPSDDVVAVGADLEPGTVLSAYRQGMFPMHLGDGSLAWWSPEPRAVLPLDGLRLTRSLRRSMKRFTVTVDRAFAEVVAGCASPDREGRWINPQIEAAYTRLHSLGWAHSVEAWSAEGDLAGGLYGVAIGGLFAGESMFYAERDASKVALVALVDGMRKGGGFLLDVQWATPHLRSLGAIEVPRERYLDMLSEALAYPLPPMFET